MNGTPLSAIALNLVKKGLNTKIYHSEKHFFTNKNKVLPETNFELAMKEYIDYLDAAIRFGIEIKNGMNINTQLLKTEIQQGNLIILAGELTGVYHTILILEYDNNKFTVFDPLYKNKQERTDIELENFINTGIGKWFISVNNKKNK